MAGAENQASVVPVVDAIVRPAEVQHVKQVEDLDAELSCDPLIDGCVLEDGKVGRLEVRAVVLVSEALPISPKSRLRERRWIEKAHAVHHPAVLRRRLDNAAERIADLIGKIVAIV